MFVLSLLLQETTAVFWCGWALFLILKRHWWKGILLAAFSCAWFAFTVKVISPRVKKILYNMPDAWNDNYVQTFHYGQIGNSISEILLSPLTRTAVFFEQLTSPLNFYFIAVLLLGFFPLALAEPFLLVTAIPLLTGLFLMGRQRRPEHFHVVPDGNLHDSGNRHCRRLLAIPEKGNGAFAAVSGSAPGKESPERRLFGDLRGRCGSAALRTLLRTAAHREICVQPHSGTSRLHGNHHHHPAAGSARSAPPRDQTDADALSGPPYRNIMDAKPPFNAPYVLLYLDDLHVDFERNQALFEILRSDSRYKLIFQHREKGCNVELYQKIL